MSMDRTVQKCQSYIMYNQFITLCRSSRQYQGRLWSGQGQAKSPVITDVQHKNTKAGHENSICINLTSGLDARHLSIIQLFVVFLYPIMIILHVCAAL